MPFKYYLSIPPTEIAILIIPYVHVPQSTEQWSKHFIGPFKC